MKYLPISLNLKNKTVLVTGGGQVALRKITTLLNTNAEVICLALKFDEQLIRLAATGNLTLIKHDLNDLKPLNDIKRLQLIVSATNSTVINQNVYKFAQLNNIWINTVDQQELCDFITPAVIDRSPITVSISSEGTAPVLARIIKQKIEYLLSNNLGLVATNAKRLRKQIKLRIPNFNNRRRFWEKYLQWSHQSSQVLTEHFKQPIVSQIDQIIAEVNQTTGKVSLVGAGPGSVDLLTIKAVKVLQEADVVLHDQLISAEIINMIRKDARLIDVGKQAGNHKTKQEYINQKLIDLAEQGLHVCRLKGGDSFVFGRGGEEVLALKAVGIDFEVVPGITAAVGCAAYAGIPLTHREHAQSLAFMTAHCSESVDTIDWQFYAKNHQTLAVYMGLIKADVLVQKLTQHGKNANEHVAIIENGTRNEQRTITGHLYQLTDMINSYHVQSPALIVIGAVAQYAKQLDWFTPNNEYQADLNYLKSA
jgi:uroporphyrin-III C-methyltransferase/precorrin-2 dehydrogenase/sirohydrochlorin ferrochelatase